MLQKCGSYVICSFKEVSEASALQKQQNNKVSKNIQVTIAAVHFIL